MTDTVKSWIEERREVQRAARGESEFDQTLDSVRMFPRALTALEQVLELHKPEAFEDAYSMQSGFMCESCYDPDKNEWVEWPCPTVQAIEGAINHD